MTYSPEDLEAFREVFTYVYCALAGTALLAYDYFITLGTEIDLIWRREFSAAKLLFLVNRYFTLASQAIILFQWLGPQGYMSCKVIGDVQHILEVILLLVTCAFGALRVWVIWAQKWYPFLLLMAVGLVPVALNVYAMTIGQLVLIPGPPPLGGCNYILSDQESAIYARLGGTCRAFLIFGDCLVIAATLIKTIDIKRAANSAGIRTKLTTLLIRDGTMYFVVLLVLNVLTLLLDYVGEAFINPATPFTDPITSILISRFIMNLRGLDNNDKVPGESTTNSTLKFALPNIGVLVDGVQLSADNMTMDRLPAPMDWSKQAAENPMMMEFPVIGVDSAMYTRDLENEIEDHGFQLNDQASQQPSSSNSHTHDNSYNLPEIEVVEIV